MKASNFIKLTVGLLSAAALSWGMAGCSEGEDIKAPNPGKPEDPGDTPPEPVYLNLSGAGTANCYVVTESGRYSFYADVMGNGIPTDGIEPAVIEPASAALVWQTSPGLIADVSLDVTDVLFTVKRTGGNALLAVYDAEGAILWSWHIWMPRKAPQGLPGGRGYEVMDMNLGALDAAPGTVASYGMLYQWGRKDPFPTASSLTGDTQTVGAALYDDSGAEVTVTHAPVSDGGIAFATANPTVYISGSDWLAVPDDNLWGNPSGAVRDDDNSYPNKGEKSIYDPCPAGWRVPPADAFKNFTSSGGYSWTVDEFDIFDLSGNGVRDADDWNFGWVFNLADGVTSFFPAAGRYYGQYGLLYGSVVGVYGNYWGNCPSDENGYVVAAFQNSDEGITLSPAAAGSRADGYSVRCIAQ